jgi:hypothetical protein
MFAREFAKGFAKEWIEAWNSHDLERVLRHYAPDAELTSPFVSRILGTETNTARGLPALREYFSRALVAFPDLKFIPRHVFMGVRSLVVQYESAGGRLSAELLEFNGAGQVFRVLAHYSTEGSPI